MLVKGMNILLLTFPFHFTYGVFYSAVVPGKLSSRQHKAQAQVSAAIQCTSQWWGSTYFPNSLSFLPCTGPEFTEVSIVAVCLNTQILCLRTFVISYHVKTRSKAVVLPHFKRRIHFFFPIFYLSQCHTASYPAAIHPPRSSGILRAQSPGFRGFSLLPHD